MPQIHSARILNSGDCSIWKHYGSARHSSRSQPTYLPTIRLLYTKAVGRVRPCGIRIIVVGSIRRICVVVRIPPRVTHIPVSSVISVAVSVSVLISVWSASVERKGIVPASRIAAISKTVAIPIPPATVRGIARRTASEANTELVASWSCVTNARRNYENAGRRKSGKDCASHCPCLKKLFHCVPLCKRLNRVDHH